MRYAIKFSYFGKNYFGYQIQPKQISIQEELEHALSTLLRNPIKITGAGRTDTGVHAKMMWAHFDTETNIDENELTKRLNRFLSPDIAIKKIIPVNATFHARFDATYRTYEYYISTEKNPFVQDSVWMYHRPLNIDWMNEACNILFEYEDFTSFAKLHTDVKTNLCTIYKAHWENKGDILKFTISANRFLRNMVRAIVGTMVEIGSGKIKYNDLHDIIKSQHRNAAGSSAPAQGLFLVEVGYNWEKALNLES